MEERPFALIGVNGLEHAPGQLRDLMEEEDLPWRSFTNGGVIAHDWSLTGTPTFYVIDAHGVIRARWVGSPGKEALDSTLERVISEAEEEVR
jgi:hypothetical protein